MNKADVELSPSSSRESLDEKQQEADACEMDWKKKVNSAASSEDEEIEISGSKTAATAAAAAAAPAVRGEEEGEEEAAAGGVSSVRRLKSATLDRMGKMLKLHSKSSGEKPDVTPTPVSNDDASRKQKFNSLTRMLRFTDKEDKSKSLGQYRGHSLTRILRRKVPIEADNQPDKPEEHVRGIFSRLLGQIKGKQSRTTKTNSSGNSSQKIKEKNSSPLPKSPSSSGLSDVNLESSCPVGMSAHQI